MAKAGDSRSCSTRERWPREVRRGGRTDEERVQHQVEEAEQLAKDIGIKFFVIKSERWTIDDYGKLNDPQMPDKKWLPEDFVKRMGL